MFTGSVVTSPVRAVFSASRLILLPALVLATLATFGGTPPVTDAAAKDTSDFAETFDRDVYVIVGSTLRNPSEDTEPSAPLFSDSGIALDLTWGDWLAATATSSVRVTGGNNPKTQVSIELTGLVPNGVYSVFYGTLQPDSEHPDCLNVERTLPVIGHGRSASGPDPSSFVADADGNATFTGRVDGDLLAPLQSFFSIVYHFDGQTYHPFPNRGEFLTQNGPNGCRASYGQDAYRQLIVFQKF